jgi:L-ascorbate metabolism protein UlaG (beta-lactamase superfamily)
MSANAPDRAIEDTATPEFAITWLGHATVLVEIDGTRLLTDPVLSDRIGPLVRIAPSVRADAVGDVDGVLLSHLHADHTDLRTLRSLERSGPVLAPPGARAWLLAKGLHDVRELGPGQQTAVGGVSVMATAATHDPRRMPFGPQAEPVGYVIRGSRSVYFAGDTDLFLAMGELRGSVDVALLPVWGWGPRVGAGHLDPDRAAAATALIAPHLTIPIHWGTYALALRARPTSHPDRPAREFAELAARYTPEVEVRVLAPGERTTLPSGWTGHAAA